MSCRAAIALILFAVISFLSCIPGSDRGESVNYTGNDSELPQEEGASDWFLHNKIDKLSYEPIPPLTSDGSLPRSIGKFSLLGSAPTDGKEYRDNQRIFYIEEITKNRRMRVFCRDEIIFRLQVFTRLTDLETNIPDKLLQLIKDEYGPPDQEQAAELAYVDRQTVILFSISNDFLVTDIMDVTMTQLPGYIDALIENQGELP